MCVCVCVCLCESVCVCEREPAIGKVIFHRAGGKRACQDLPKRHTLTQTHTAGMRLRGGARGGASREQLL